MSYGDYVEQLTYLLFLKMVAKSATLSSVATSGPPRTSSSTSSSMRNPAQAKRPCRRVVADNVLFECGAGEAIHNKIQQECDVHTLLCLPTGQIIHKTKKKKKKKTTKKNTNKTTKPNGPTC